MCSKHKIKKFSYARFSRLGFLALAERHWSIVVQA